MRFNIITIFPNIFDSYFSESILKRARDKGLIDISVINLRDFTNDTHKTVDDKPFGGGPGMILKIEPIWRCVQFLKSNFKSQISNHKSKQRIILFSAKGKQFKQKDAKRLAKYDELILICGRYEGVDERVAKYIADEEISIGEYVLTGGEIPAMILVDAISRLIPNVLGKEESLAEESFKKDGYLEYPQYTRPENFNNWKVPKILLSGNHKKIEEWRKNSSKLKVCKVHKVKSKTL